MRDLASRHRTGVVLAAGMGTRLIGVLGADLPKPLVSVGGTPLLIRTLGFLERAGCDRAVVVLGHRAECFAALLYDEYSGGLLVDLALNPRPELGNGLSVLAAKDRMDG